MRKIIRAWPFFLALLVFDRFLFLPGRMAGTWEYEQGKYIGETITFEQNIDIISNFEIKISGNRQLDSFYLLGCYFGTLFLLDKDTLGYTTYVEEETNLFLD